jgi:mycofactocin precursor
MDERQKRKREPEEIQDERRDDTLFDLREIEIEEMAIDGICGVY